MRLAHEQELIATLELLEASRHFDITMNGIFHQVSRSRRKFDALAHLGRVTFIRFSNA